MKVRTLVLIVLVVVFTAIFVKLYCNQLIQKDEEDAPEIHWGVTENGIHWVDRSDGIREYNPK